MMAKNEKVDMKMTPRVLSFCPVLSIIEVFLLLLLVCLFMTALFFGLKHFIVIHSNTTFSQ